MHLMCDTRGDDRQGMNTEVLVIGLGNEFRSDDGLGLCAAREVQRRGPPGVRVMECSGEGTALLEAWKGAECVLLIDAICPGHSAGSLHRIDCRRDSTPHSLFRSSSHTFGVSEAIALATSLGSLPRVLLLYGIEGCNFTPGQGLSDAVVRSIPDLIAWIGADIADLTHTNEPARGTP